MDTIVEKRGQLNYCIVCNKRLCAIGLSRKNGKQTFSDWSGRLTHKKCYQIYQAEKIRKLMEKTKNEG